MESRTIKPLLLLDVDGVLNPYPCLTEAGFKLPKVKPGDNPFSWERFETQPNGWDENRSLPVLLSRDMGEQLAELGSVFTLIWATTWEHDANKWLSPKLGLPELPVIEWPRSNSSSGWSSTGTVNFEQDSLDLARAWARNSRCGSWKTKWVAQWLDDFGRYRDSAGELRHLPWVWIDDEVNRFDRKYLKDWWEEKEAPTANRWLLRTVDNTGMTSRHLDELAAWGETNHVEI